MQASTKSIGISWLWVLMTALKLNPHHIFFQWSELLSSIYIEYWRRAFPWSWKVGDKIVPQIEFLLILSYVLMQMHKVLIQFFLALAVTPAILCFEGTLLVCFILSSECWFVTCYYKPYLCKSCACLLDQRLMNTESCMHCVQRSNRQFILFILLLGLQ